MRLQPVYYNLLLQTISPLYPTLRQIEVVMNSAGLQPSKAELLGTGEHMWDSVLLLALKEEKLEDLVAYILQDSPNQPELEKMLAAIKDKTALATVKSFDGYLKPASAGAIKTFLVYDQEDKEIVSKLRMQLYPLQQFSNKIILYDMHLDIKPGFNKEEEWLKNLGDSGIVLLMITPWFIGNPNNNCYPLAEAGFEMNKRVIPVLLKDSAWKQLELLGDIQPLPLDSEFVSAKNNTDKALLEIAESVGHVADAMRK